MFKLWAKYGQKKSEKEIKSFLALLRNTDENEIGVALCRSALIHFSFSKMDPEFDKLVNSEVGQNQGAILNYILQLNDLVNQFANAGESENASGMKIWNITFRCMSHNAFRYYGQELWVEFSKHFDKAKEFLEFQLEHAQKNNDEKMIEKVNGALSLYDFIPPQFR